MSIFLGLATQNPAPDTTMIRVVAGIAAVAIIAVIIVRRKAKKKKVDDEF